MSTPAKTYITPEQYLEIEAKAEYKSEYFRGEMFAMAGASTAHNDIVHNAVFALHDQLRSSDCRVRVLDTRVRALNGEFYTYPDLTVVCGKREVDRRNDTLANPTVIIEVLSPSTEAYDRGKKFEYYQTIESFRQYLLIASDRVRVDLYTRQENGKWLMESASTLEGTLELQSIGCQLKLAELYHQVDFLRDAPEPPVG